MKRKTLVILTGSALVGLGMYYIIKKSGKTSLNIHSVEDIYDLADSLVENETDDIWQKSIRLLLVAILLYMYDTDPSDMTAERAIKLLTLKNMEDPFGNLDKKFEKLKAVSPEDISVKYYETFKSGAEKTMTSVAVSALNKFKEYKVENG